MRDAGAAPIFRAGRAVEWSRVLFFYNTTAFVGLSKGKTRHGYTSIVASPLLYEKRTLAQHSILGKNKLVAHYQTSLTFSAASASSALTSSPSASRGFCKTKINVKISLHLVKYHRSI